MSTPPAARRIDGRAIAARLRAQAAEVTSALRERGGQPLLAVADPTAGDEGAAAVTPAAAALTPVPGGVGPVTTAQLLRQTAAAAWRAETGRIQS